MSRGSRASDGAVALDARVKPEHDGIISGDDLRRLDWHALARLDVMLIRLYAAEETLPIEIIIDTSASMDFGEPTKYITGARVGCALTQIALLHATPALWRFANEKPLEPVKLSGRNDIPRVLRVLDEVVPDGRSTLGEAIRRSALAGPRRKSLVVITDGYDTEEIRPALRACRAAGAEVYLLLVLAPEETDPSVRGEFTFIDAESGTEAALSLDRPTLKRYMQMLESFRADWTDFCRTSGVVMIELSSDQPIDAELFRALASGGLIS